MKIYALAVLLVCCVVENASAADWKFNVKMSHWEHINSIVNDTLAKIRRDVNAKGTSAAEQCYENARLELRSATQTGYSGVTSCVNSASNAGDANVCAQRVDSQVFETSLVVSRTANECLKNA